MRDETKMYLNKLKTPDKKRQIQKIYLKVQQKDRLHQRNEPTTLLEGKYFTTQTKDAVPCDKDTISAVHKFFC
jgi:hypothetical protein